MALPVGERVGNIMTSDMGGARIRSGARALTGWRVPNVPTIDPKESLKDQLIEDKANLVRMLEFVQLTEDEKLLVTEGIELHQVLIEQLTDVPTPAGPTPRELEQSRQPETKVIPLKAVRKNKKNHG